MFLNPTPFGFFLPGADTTLNVGSIPAGDIYQVNDPVTSRSQNEIRTGSTPVRAARRIIVNPRFHDGFMTPALSLRISKMAPTASNSLLNRGVRR